MPGISFRSILVLSTFLDAASVLVVLAAPPWHGVPGPRRITLSRLVVACFVVALAFAVKAPFGFSAGGLELFGLLHLVYVDLVVLVPLLGATLLAASRFGRVRLERAVPQLCAVALSFAGVGIYASLIEPRRLQLETATIVSGSEALRPGPLRIGVLADLQTDHIGPYERRAVRRLLEQRPDLILIPGDLFQADPATFETELPALRALLAELQAPLGTFFVPGDVDPPLDQLGRVLGGTPVRLLLDDVATITRGGASIRIGGITAAYDSPGAARTIDRLADGPPGDLRLLLSHRPDVALGLDPEAPIDLVVSGHTHGGQVVIPGFGPPMTLSRVPRVVAAGGLHRLEGHAIYVSRGVGHERGQAPRLRFWCPPEISLLTLRPLESHPGTLAASPILHDPPDPDTHPESGSMDQPVARYEAADLDRVIARDFPNIDAKTVKAALEQYGSEPWHNEPLRVRMACLKLADGDLARLEKYVADALTDYRDVLAWAEYPAYLQAADPDSQRKAIASDWDQLQSWLKRE